MNYARRSPWSLALALTAALACGKEGDDTLGGSTDLATTDLTGSSTDATDATTTDAPTSDPLTSGGTDSAAGTTTDVPTTGVDSTTGDESTTGDDSTTGVDVSEFERFKLSRAAGPCPPEEDCDGFIELLADGTLRHEKFGELDNPVVEAEVSADDLAAASAVFADPELIAVLDGPSPACDPPTDIFEMMVSQIAGTEHQTATTLCELPPLVAARAMANMLQMKYLP